MVQDRSPAALVLRAANYVLMTAIGLTCLLPLVHVLAVSLSSRSAATGNLVTFWPIGFNLVNYDKVLRDAQFHRSLIVSLERVVLGTSVSMAVTVLAAYPMSITEGFRGKGVFRWLLIVAMLFYGGMIPTYLAIRSLGLIDKLGALIFPGAVNMWNIIILLNFFRSLPIELSEAATVDGASHWNILFGIYLPLSKPALATLTMFSAVGHWNAWFDGMLYMNSPTKYPLQTYIKSAVLSLAPMIVTSRDSRAMAYLSQRASESALIFLGTLPILLVYPFLQRYFVSGLTLGSVKG